MTTSIFQPNHLPESSGADGVAPGRRRPVREKAPVLFWLAVLGLACITMAGVCWAASTMLAQKGTEKLLQVRLLLPKLNSNHGERKAVAFRTSEPVPSALAHPKERATPTPAHFPPAVEHPKVTIVNAPQSAVGPAPTSEPSLNAFWDRFQMKMDAMTAEMTELPPVETCLDPVVYLEPCAPKRGDTPMMRNWKMITMISLMSAAAIPLAPMPIVAGEKETGELKKSIDKLIERIDALERKPLDDKAIAKALRNELDKLEKGMLAEIQTDIAGVQSEQRKLKKQFEDQKFLIELLTGRIDSLEKKVALGGTATPSVDKAFMDELRTMIRGINDTLAKSGPIQERRSMSAPTGNGDLGQGRVLLANYYPEQLLFVVNGVGYRLPARSTKLVDVPSGTVSYEVFSERYGVLERRTTNLASGNTFNLSAQ